MSLNGNWVDLLVILFLAGYAWTAKDRGFVALTVEMITFLGAFFLALNFYPVGATFLTENFAFSVNLAKATAFVAIALLAEAVFGSLLIKIRLPPGDRYLGIIPAAVDGFIIAAFFLIIAISLPIQPAIKYDIVHSRVGGSLYHHSLTLEKTLDGIFGGVVVGLQHETVNLHFAVTETSVDSAGEREMFDFVNQQRASHALPLLKLDQKLTEVARAHSRDMFARGYFSHVNPDGRDSFARMHAAEIFFTSAGENIAYAPTTASADTGLFNSPEHRDNILSPAFTKVGIGVIDAGIYGKMFTQDFTD
jgi:uncharacterized membrane protein required for colicin V production